MSPLISKKINAPANLEGQFWIHCNFSPNEKQTLKILETELDGLKFNGMKNKRESKWQQKNAWKEKEKNVEFLGVDQILQRAIAVPPCLIEDFTVLKEP